MLFNPQPETLNEASLLGTLLEGSSYSLDSKPITNVGTIGHASLPALNPIAEAVTTAMADGHFKLLEGLMEEDFVKMNESTSMFIEGVREDMTKFNEGVAIFAKSSELKSIEETIDKYCKQTQGFMLDAVGLHQDFVKISDQLEKYFGFGNLVVACKGMEALLALKHFRDLSKIRKEYKGKIRDAQKNVDAMSSDEQRNANRSLEKAREELDKYSIKRSKEILITTTGGMGIPNAFTTKTDFIAAMQQQFNEIGAKIDGSDGKLKWTNDIKPFTYIEVQLGLMTMRDITGGNILGIILHEVGHSFYQGSIVSRAISMVMSVLRTLMKMLKYIDYYATKLVVGGVSKSTLMSNAYNIAYSAIFNIFNIYHSVMQVRISGKITELLGPDVGQVVDIATMVGRTTLEMIDFFSVQGSERFKASLTNPMTLVTFLGMDGLSEEKFCDNFAAAHGYGPELADAFSKMGGVAPWSSDKNKDSVLSNIRASIAFVNSIVSGLMHITDTHPTHESRPLFIIDFYKGELKKTKDPKTRKYIEGLIVQTLKYSAYYQVSSKPIKSRLMQQALAKDETMFHNNTPSLLDLVKNALSPETGNMNNLSKAVMK